MTRRHLPTYTRIPAGRYVVVTCVFNGSGELWFGEADRDTRVYGWTGPRTLVGFSKGWGPHARLMPLTDDEAARLLAAAKLLDLRGEAWRAYLQDFVSTLTNEGAPA